MKSTNHFYPFELKPSAVRGVGMFSRIRIKKGTNLTCYLKSDAIFVKNIPDEQMRDKFCVKTRNGWWCPIDFGRMSMWWYVNHSDNPNVSCNGDTYIALETINTGDEITIDYDKLNGHDNLTFRPDMKK